MEELIYDVELKSLHTKLKWVIEWEEGGWRRLEFLYENIYQPLCIKVLRRYLQMEKSSVMRKGETVYLLQYKNIT